MTVPKKRVKGQHKNRRDHPWKRKRPRDSAPRLI